MIKETNVTVLVSDIKRAVRFYTDTLGLELKAQWGDEFAQTIIALHPALKGGAKPGNSKSLSICFGVDSLEKTIARLNKRG